MKKICVCLALIGFWGSSVFGQEAQIGAVKVKIILGDVTQQGADAVLVPHFDGAVSWGGVGAAVARRGGGDGLEAAEKYFAANKVGFGEAFVTQSNGLHTKLVNVVSVGSGREVEFSIVQQAVVNGLDKATVAGVTSFALPALGTGIIGELTAKQSAQAILSAINFYAIKGGTIADIRIVIYGDKAAYDDFVNVLSSRSYERVDTLQFGTREFDFERWSKEMKRDHGVEVIPIKTSADCGNLLGKIFGSSRKP